MIHGWIDGWMDGGLVEVRRFEILRKNLVRIRDRLEDRSLIEILVRDAEDQGVIVRSPEVTDFESGGVQEFRDVLRIAEWMEKGGRRKGQDERMKEGRMERCE